jgi:hypothetical protein
MNDLLDTIQVEEIDIFDYWEDQWESITETDESDWAGIEFNF